MGEPAATENGRSLQRPKIAEAYSDRKWQKLAAAENGRNLQRPKMAEACSDRKWQKLAAAEKGRNLQRPKIAEAYSDTVIEKGQKKIQRSEKETEKWK